MFNQPPPLEDVNLFTGHRVLVEGLRREGAGWAEEEVREFGELVLAQAPGGLTCFLLPRFTPDGERNRFHLQRLKDKLGNRS